MIDYSNLAARGMTDDEMRQLRERLTPKAYVKKDRYGSIAERTEYNGVYYDSKAEAHYAAYLDLEKLDGRVRWWIRQVTILLGPDHKTRVDFLVMLNLPGGSEVEAHEVKGCETSRFAKVRRLWPKYAPFRMKVIKRGGKIEFIEGC